MARVALLSPDLLFGSKVEGALTGAGHSVGRFDGAEELRAAGGSHDIVIFDLTTDEVDGVGLLEELRGRGELEGTPTLGYYSHVDAETRARAIGAGFTQVVPRSRMAREGAALVERLVGSG